MREIRSYGSVGEREGNDPLYPESISADSRYQDFSIYNGP